MNRRISRQNALTLAAYFALITSICGAFAYMAGKARGARLAHVDASAPLFGTAHQGSPDYEKLIRARRAGADCAKGEAGSDRFGSWEVFCGPASQSEGGAYRASAPARRMAQNHAAANAGRAGAQRKNPGPLQKAVLRAIAEGGGQGLSGGAAQAAPSPGEIFSLARAPTSGAGGVGFAPGTALAPGGAPGLLIPGQTGEPPAAPPSDGPPAPPVLVTPLPPAALLMLAGLGALVAPMRRTGR